MSRQNEEYQTLLAPESASEEYGTTDTEKGVQTEKALSPLALLAIVYFLVCGGAYGTEDLGGTIPPLFAILGVLIVPWIWSLPMALITAELASAIPHKGGFLHWMKRGFGDFVSYLDGWMMVIVVIIDQALYPIIFVSYFEKTGVWELTYWTRYAVCIVYIFICLLVNLTGVKNVGNASKIFSLVTLLPFAVFVGAGLFSPKLDWSVLWHTEGSWEYASLYLSVLIWATCGYEYSGFLAGDVKNPKRDFPLVMISSVFLMVLTYLLPIGIGMATWPLERHTDIQEGFYPVLADNLDIGKWVGWTMTVGGLMSTMGTYNAYLHTSSTALHSLSSDGNAPAVFSKLPQFKVPVVCIIFYSFTTAILDLFEFEFLVEIEAMLYGLHAILLSFTFVRLRMKEPNLHRPFRIPFGYFGAGVACFLPSCVALLNIAISNWLMQVVSVSIPAVGVILYAVHQLWVRSRGTDPSIYEDQ